MVPYESLNCIKFKISPNNMLFGFLGIFLNIQNKIITKGVTKLILCKGFLF